MIEDTSNYHGLKLTTKKRNNKKRREIKNWESKGLKKKSYIRIEMPIKIEQQQLIKKISELETDELIDIYISVYSLLNIEALEKITRTYSLKEKKYIKP